MRRQWQLLVRLQLLLLCASARAVTAAAAGSLAVSWAPSGSAYEISLGGALWLRSAPVTAYISGQWFAAAPAAAHEQQLQYRAQRSWTGRDALGTFAATTVEWSAGSVPLRTHTRVYNSTSGDSGGGGGAALVFEQELPLGANGTQFETSCAQDLEQVRHAPFFVLLFSS
jgi:hypothetical protein